MHHLRLKKLFVLIFLLVLLAPSLAAGAETILPEPYKGGRQTGILIGDEGERIGTATYWNRRNHFHVELNFDDENTIVKEAQVYLGREEPLYDPLFKNGKPVPGKFPCKVEGTTLLSCDLEQDFAFKWGQNRSRWVAVHGDLTNNSFWLLPMDEFGNADSYVPYPKLKHGGYFDAMMTHPARGHFIDSPVFGLGYQTPTQWGVTDIAGGFDYFPSEFVDFWIGSYHLGSAIGDQKVSPLDIFTGYDTTIYITDPETGIQTLNTENPVINMARFLQSLDADGEPKQGISITEPVVVCLETAMGNLGYTELYFNLGGYIEDILVETVFVCEGVEGVNLNIVTYEEAKENLDKSQSSMLRKNISRTPDLGSSKSKLNIMPMYFPALRANGDPAYYTDETGQIVYDEIPYYDENLQLAYTRTEAKPIVAVYTDAVQGEDGTVYGEDVFAAISRDDGNTFKRKNIARAADRSSFDVTVKEYDELGNVVDEYLAPYYGEAKKPVFQVKGNKILVAWTSKYCNGGRPTYAIKTEDTPDDPTTPENEFEENYPYDDPYFEEDIWGVSGPQRSVDYTDQGFPEVGEVPYSCVWTARGTLVTEEMLADTEGYWATALKDPLDPESTYSVGDIVWYKPERLTSGRRDANQVFMGAADDAGFAIAWQEDPEGLRPGQAKGPGPGWGGATTNHKTDIWYSYITWDDFLVVDENFESHGENQSGLTGRPKALVPMSLPVRVSDNDVVNTDNLKIEVDPETKLPEKDSEGNYIFTKLPPVDDPDSNGDHMGSHDYALPDNNPGLCVDFYYKIPYSQRDLEEGEEPDFKQVCITADGRLLDGNTGASRPNLFLQKYKKPDGTFSAYAIFAYEESKGMGSGPPDHVEGEGPYGDEYLAEQGKNSIYHSFDFQNPDLVSAGTLINLPEKQFEVDEEGNPVFVDAEGNPVEVDEYGLPLVEGATPNILSDFTFVMDEVVDESGNVTYEPRLDHNGLMQLNYENARRPRFIMQGKSGVGDSGTIMMILYKEGQEGSGRPSDIMLRRVVVDGPGNPYSPNNILCTATETVDLDPTDEGIHNVEVCVGGAQNMSTVQPKVVTPSMGDSEQEDPYGAIKVVEYKQTLETLDWPSGINPYEDARAHRGALMGDLVIMGYSYTPNWAAYRNGNDKYDFFIRRSFDGGQTWTTDPLGVKAFDIVTNTETGQPEAVPGDTFSVVNCDTYTDPTLDEGGNPVGEITTGPHYHYTVCDGYLPGEFEQARNLSQLPNAKSSVIEPRIVKAPGTIKLPNGDPTGYPEDINTFGMYYVSYGTATNPKKEKAVDPETGEPLLDEDGKQIFIHEEPAPMDLYYSFSLDYGETHELVEWVVNPESEGNYAGETVTRWDWLAKGDQEQGEAQLRMTPDGSRFYATWVQEGYDNKGDYGSDIWFRRIMRSEFPNNVAPTTTPIVPE